MNKYLILNKNDLRIMKKEFLEVCKMIDEKWDKRAK